MPILRGVEDITYWAPQTTDVFGGDTFSGPTVLQGRWEDETELIRDKKGQESVSMSKAYLEIDLDVNGYLFRGISTVTDPRTIDAFEIKQKSSVPDLRQLRQLRVAYL